MKRAVFFDLDDTLVLTSSIKHLRDRRKWGEVYRSLSKTSLPAGTREFIEGCRPNFALGVITNSPRVYAERLLHHHGLSVPVFVAYHDTRLHKPHPAPILRAAEIVAIDPAHCIYIGDLKDDVEAGKAAGVTTLVISWGSTTSTGDLQVPVCRSWLEIGEIIAHILRDSTGAHGESVVR